MAKAASVERSRQRAVKSRRTSTTVPPETQRHVERAVMDGRRVSAEALSEALKSEGRDVSASSIYRYAEKFAAKHEAMKNAVDRALLLTATVEQTPGAMSEAVVSLIQTEIFDILVAFEEATVEEEVEKRLKLLSIAAATIADLTRASTALRKYQEEIQAALQKASVSADYVVESKGLSSDAWSAIRQKFLGILPP